MALMITNRKRFIIFATAVTTTFLVMITYTPQESPLWSIAEARRRLIDWRNLTPQETDHLSVLGRILYLEDEPPKISKRYRKYQILVWKYGKQIEGRHMKQYGTTLIDPFADCSVNNCEITYEDKDLDTADIVVYHLQRMHKLDLPKRKRYTQIWAFLTDESPFHTFLSGEKLSNFDGVFNWSMTYRMDSDIPVPYGRTVLRKTPYIEQEEPSVGKRRDVLVAILGSNCGGRNNRWGYVKELQKYITVDVYGGCGTLKTCPGHFRENCKDIDSYMFYLAFENSNCDDYITEKLWWNAYEKNSIPIVMGATKENYHKLLPPNSYLNTEDYAHPKDLAAHILYLNSTEKYREMYEWKRDFEVLNEHGFFQSRSYHYCRVCEALNYNSRELKVYKDLKWWWSVKKDCHPPWNV